MTENVMSQNQVQSLPRLSAAIDDIQGELKLNPADFIVRELPLYATSGQGEHIYLELERVGQNTRDVVRDLSRLLKIPDKAIGTAGLKDRQACARQFFSLHMPQADAEQIAKQIEDNLALQILQVSRHSNKLRTGHLKANHFQIKVHNPGPDALQKAQVRCEFIQQNGLPNYYGEQRFGKFADNHILGLKILHGHHRMSKGWKRRLLLSALQSWLFNSVLAERIRSGNFKRLLIGDVAIKTDSGGLFLVEDPMQDMERFMSFAICHSGPIFGQKMKDCEGEPQELEQRILAEAGIQKELFDRRELPGSRRANRMQVMELDVSAPAASELFFRFSLPPGSYATMVMREFGIQ